MPMTTTLGRSLARGCGGPALQPGSLSGLGAESQQPTPSLSAAYGVLQHLALAGQRTCDSAHPGRSVVGSRSWRARATG